ncbi:MAG: hypothetical protein JWN17_1486 [Frankiales bacterium]|nr:hypothetical protein [Frankiales bacterium]
MRRSRLVVPLLALALGASACGGSGGSGSGGSSGGGKDAALAPAAVVRAASATSTKAGSSKFELDSSTVVQGQPLTIKGAGLFDYGARKGSLTLTLPIGTVQQRVVDGKVYLALSQDPGHFYALPLDQVQGTSLGGSTDPSASFAQLSAVEDGATKVGTEKVRGEDTTHYRGTLDVKKALSTTDATAKQIAAATLGRAGVDELPFDAWIDSAGRLRRYVQVLEVPAGPTTGGQPVKSTTTLELFDFGTKVDVVAPPASQIKDGAPLLAALKRQSAAVSGSGG